MTTMQHFTGMLGTFGRYWEVFKTKLTGKHAEAWLGVYSFFETIIIPFPTDPILALLVHVNPKRVVWLTVWTTVTSVIAALVGYVFAYGLYDIVAAPLISYLGISAEVAQVAETLNEYVFIATFIAAFTPIPFAPLIFAAGFLKSDLLLFLAATILGRGIRFGIVSALVYVFGAAILPKLGGVISKVTIGVVLALLIALVLFIVV